MDSDKTKKVEQVQTESQPTVKDIASASDKQMEGTLKLEQPEGPSKNGARDNAREDVTGDREQDVAEDVNMDVDVGSVEKGDLKDADDTEPASSSAAEGDQDPTGSSELPRVTRSRNPDFAAKQKNFMKEYRRSTGGQVTTPIEEVDSSRCPTTEPAADVLLAEHGQDGSAPAAESSSDKRSSSTPAAESSSDKRNSSTPDAESSTARRVSEQSDAADCDTPAGAALNDNFCWVCHREGKVICCETCPRVFHLKCVQLGSDPPGDWVCVECRRVVQAENVDNLSATMKQLSQEQFVQLLTYAIGRLKGLPGAEPFTNPVDPKKFPHYREVVACPMDLLVMEQNTKNGMYGSTEAFIADCKWIVHNCILFNSNGSKLTTLAKSLLRMCKWEMEEIETCPDCYGNAYATDNWFMEACPNPHLLIWARLKGFPFWPAKAMKSREGNVDCRFFGRHDRAWVPIKECFLYSKEPPCPPKSRSKSLDSCIEELEEHIRNLEKQFGEYVYAKPRTAYDPKKVDQHLKMTIPGYQGTTPTTDQDTSKRKRSNSDIQLEMLEKLRQGKKARKSVSATLQEVRAAEKNNGEPVTPVADEQPPDDPIETATEEMPAADQAVEERPQKNARKSLAGTVRNVTSVEETANKKPAVASSKKMDTSVKDKTVISAKETVDVAKKADIAKETVDVAKKADIAKEKVDITKEKVPASAVKELSSAVTAGSNKTLKSAVSGGMRMVPISAAQAAGLKQKVVRVPATLAGSGGSPGVRQSVMMSPGARPQALRTNGLTPRAARPQQRPGTAALLQMARAPLHGNTRMMAPRAAATLPQPASADSQFTIVGPSTLGPLMVAPGSANTAVVSAAAGPRTTSGLITAAAGDAASSDLGPVSAELDKQAKGLTEMMRTGLEKVLNELAMAGSPQATVAGLKLQLERLQWKHQMELAEQKKVADSMLSEVRSSMEMDQKRALQKLNSSFTAERRELERQMELKVAETKKKQWCANCGKEAIFYCCWNTSYCDFPCQEAQWPKHMLTCANQQGQHQQTVDGGGSDSSR